jgi:hypothetical protein
MFACLLFFNLITWFLPLVFLKGVARSYFLILAFIFSGSYWIPVAFYNEGKIPDNVVFDYIQESLIYSLAAAISFYFGLFVARRRAIVNNLENYFKITSRKIKVNKSSIFFLKFTTWINLLSIYLLALQHVDVGDRVYFLDEINAFWYYYLLPLSSVQIAAWILVDKNSIVKNSIRVDLLLWLAVLMQVFLVGFDGSRRHALLPIFLIAVKVAWFNIAGKKSVFVLNGKSIFLLLILLFSVLMTLNRAFDVGWGVLNLQLLAYIEYIPVFLELLFSASPTIHVNTQMLELVSQEGVHGFGSYFMALGNFLFPKFIFGRYFFGEPLVLALHERFGWYGQDFGFMAEAIYSGGVWGVLLMHFLYGSFVALVINGYSSKKYAIFYKIISLCILYGAVNSLRSDFMNLLKATFYPAIGLIIMYWLTGAVKLLGRRR